MPEPSPRAVPLVILAAVLAACTFPPLTTPTPRPPAMPSATAFPSAPTQPTPTTSLEPDPAQLTPDFDAGQIVTSAINGLRVRTGPGVDRPIATGLLPLGFELRVILGPIPIDDLGWYLVADAHDGEPDFGEGWVAAGSVADPLLAATGRVAPDSTAVASMAGAADAELGPVVIGSGDHAIRWVALDPGRARCTFGVSLAAAGGAEPIPAIRATVGSGIDRGTMQPQSFAALGLRGDVFVSVTSDCAWALVIERVPPQATPSATASPGS